MDDDTTVDSVTFKWAVPENGDCPTSMTTEECDQDKADNPETWRFRATGGDGVAITGYKIRMAQIDDSFVGEAAAITDADEVDATQSVEDDDGADSEFTHAGLENQ